MRDAPARGSPPPHCLMAVGGGSSPHLGVSLPSGAAPQPLRDTGHYFTSPLISSFFYIPDEFAITLKKEKFVTQTQSFFSSMKSPAAFSHRNSQTIDSPCTAD